ncbi:hypothetical protein [Hymenobacter aerophilus]|uniref:hypothetical protein n=1 Tax=Hymenobacter aerophilus TaxID=119644 RepID=UPI00037AAFD1|nr:hypothetical protein [Hymenobacter aerophilus]
MLLGVYWYYGFPEGLYHFDFFTFRPGLGGHADGPAELTATVRAPEPTALLAEVRVVADRYPEAYLFAEPHETLLRLRLGDYALSDYSFHVATELEKVLRRQQAVATPERPPAGVPLLRLAVPHDPTPSYRYGGLLGTGGGSSQGQYHAEHHALRLDCHLPQTEKAAFLHVLAGVSEQAGLEVLYYFDQPYRNLVNLMVLFANGRQGINGQALRYTDVVALEQAVQQQLTAYGGKPDHRGGAKSYPEQGPHILRMTDAEFIL